MRDEVLFQNMYKNFALITEFKLIKVDTRRDKNIINCNKSHIIVKRKVY